MVAITSGVGAQWLTTDPWLAKVATNFFLSRFPDARNNSSVLIGKLTKGTPAKMSGRFVVHPVRFGRNTGVGAVGRRGVIPEPGQQSAEQYSSRARKGMARILLDGDVIRNGKTDGGAYMTAMQFEMEGVIDDMMMDRARQVHNDGSGRIAEVSSIAAGAGGIVTLKVNSDIEGAANTRGADTLNADGWMHVGMRVMFVSASGATLATCGGNSGMFIAAIATSGNNVTITLATAPLIAANVDPSAAVAIAAGMWMVRAHQATQTAFTTTGGFIDSGFKNEIPGLSGFMSDIGVRDGQGANGVQQSGVELYDDTNGTNLLQGLTVSSFLWHQAVVLDNAGAGNRALTERLLQQATSEAARKNNGKADLLLSASQAYDSYVETLVPDKRFVNTTELHGGHSVLDFNGIPWEVDRFCYQNRVIGLRLSELEMLEVSPVGPLTVEDESVWQRVTAGTSAGDRDIYWRGWEWDDTLMLTGIRQRMGFLLCELTA